MPLPDFDPPLPFEASFDGAYGLELDVEDLESEGVVRGRVPVRAELLGAHGAVHGGVLASLAESIASTGTWIAVTPRGCMAMGQSNDTNLLAPLSAGVIHAEARAVARGEDAWLWTVEATDGDGAAIAFSRITVAVRPAR